MKKNFTLYLIGILILFCGAPVSAQYGRILYDDFEGANEWTETHSNFTIYNKWFITDCNVIEGTKSATIRGAQLVSGGCYFYPYVNGNSRLYRKIQGKCGYHYFFRFSWKCNTDKEKARGSVVYSFDGVNWTRITTGGPDNDGYYYGSAAVQTSQMYLPSINSNFNYNDYYIGFQFETFNYNNAGGIIPFTVDEVLIEGIKTNPNVDAGPDVLGCPGESLTLNGSGSPRANASTKTNGNVYPIPLASPGSVTVSEIDASSVYSLLGASQLLYVVVDVNYQATPDLDLVLEAPNGSSIHLSQNNGGALTGGYNNTTFSATANQSASQTSNFNNAWVKPDEPFTNLTGSASGKWKLKVTNSGVLSGEIQSWSIVFANQVFFSWTPLNGLTNPTSAVTTANANENTLYTLTATDSRGCASSDQALVTVVKFPQVTGPQSDVYADKWSTVTINVLADAYDYTYNWEVKEKNSDTWSPLQDDATYSGTSASLLNISNVNPNMDENQYRVFVGRCFSQYTISVPATLHINNGTQRKASVSNLDKKEWNETHLFPMPFNEHLDINYRSEEKGMLKVVVYNTIGEQMLERTFQLEAGNNKCSLPTAEMPSGIYVVKFGSEVYKVVKE